jgi:DNA-binding transcriptional regulator LsrR (DeoR family)
MCNTRTIARRLGLSQERVKVVALQLNKKEIVRIDLASYVPGAWDLELR